ncbi:hypothetical protein B0J14DRAFT_137750 [Halenospora varia]|nr:hypothetical protein B0J14DRAFT_137750 [Halenospora varia]
METRSMRKNQILWAWLFFCFLSGVSSCCSSGNCDERHSPIRFSHIKDPRPDGITYLGTSERNKEVLLRHLHATSDQDLEQYSKAGPHKISLDYSSFSSKTGSEAFLKYLLNTSQHHDSSWNIETIPGAGWEPLTGNWTLLSTVVERLPNVTQFRWATSFPIPKVLLATSEKAHPKCRLYYEIVGDLSNSLSLLLHSQNLYSMKARVIGDAITRGKVKYVPSEAWDVVRRILETSPNIRELDLNVIHDILPVDVQEAFNLAGNHSTIPPLRSLSLRGYNFEAEPTGEEFVPYIQPPQTLIWPLDTFPGFIIRKIGKQRIERWGGMYQPPRILKTVNNRKTNLDAWMEQMDWTHLHTLRLTTPTDQIHKLAGGFLPALKHVTFDGEKWPDTLDSAIQFLANIPALQSISLQNTWSVNPQNVTRNITDIITKHHCPTLVSFKLDTVPLTAIQLSQLREHCPNIQSLDIGMERAEEWDYKLLDILATFPDLENLVLRWKDEEYRDYWDVPREYSDFTDPISQEYYSRDDNAEEESAIMKGVALYLRRIKTRKKFQKIETWVEGYLRGE